MASLEEVTGSEYLSFSTMTQYFECGERFRLERVEKVPRGQAWWFLGGNAFHEATEFLDRGEIRSSLEAWETAWANQMSQIRDISQVQAGGRRTRQYPRGEDQSWWENFGPFLVGNYAKWRSEKRLAGWSLLELDGKPAVEVPFRVDFNGVPVQGVIDRIWLNSEKAPIIVDYKAGSKPPTSNLQLAVYASAFEKAYGVPVLKGAYYLARMGNINGPFALQRRGLESLDEKFSQALEGISNRNFPANITSRCATCPVKNHCSVYQALESR